jgi:hypothetical protein
MIDKKSSNKKSRIYCFYHFKYFPKMRMNIRLALCSKKPLLTLTLNKFLFLRYLFFFVVFFLNIRIKQQCREKNYTLAV